MYLPVYPSESVQHHDGVEEEDVSGSVPQSWAKFSKNNVEESQGINTKYCFVFFPQCECVCGSMCVFCGSMCVFCDCVFCARKHSSYVEKAYLHKVTYREISIHSNPSQ